MTLLIVELLVRRNLGLWLRLFSSLIDLWINLILKSLKYQKIKKLENFQSQFPKAQTDGLKYHGLSNQQSNSVWFYCLNKNLNGKQIISYQNSCWFAFYLLAT